MTCPLSSNGFDIAAAWAKRARELATWTRQHLVVRTTAWGGYRPPEEVGKEYTDRDGKTRKLGAQTTRKGKLTEGVLTRHYSARGRAEIIGLHSTGPDNTSLAGAVDIDHHGETSTTAEVNQRAALHWHASLSRQGFHPLLTDSNGKGGFHLRVLFREPVPTRRVFFLLKTLIADHAGQGFPDCPETFPKQPQIDPVQGFGNWLRLPGRHHSRDYWSTVYDGCGEWLAGNEAIDYMLALTGDEPSLIPADVEMRFRVNAYMDTLPRGLGEGMHRDDVAYQFLAWLGRDMSLSDDEALDYAEQWDRQNATPKGRERLIEILENTKIYGKNPSGSGLGGNGYTRRPMLAVAGAAVQTAPDDAGPPEDKRPTILIGVDEGRVNDEAIAALTRELCLFQRGNMLVHVLRDETKRCILRPAGAPRIVELPNARLREMMANAAEWHSWKANRGGKHSLVPAHPPGWSVAGIAARGSWPAIRYLAAVVEAPTLRPDGTLLDTPGWDEATGLLYEPRISFPSVPAHPSKAEASAAADKLLDIVAEFPFAGAQHGAAWLASFLTPMGRFAFPGPAPLFLFSANTPGSGKTLLATITAEANDGREMARTPCPTKDEEMAKTITAVALAGDRMMLLDNIDSATSFGCASLDAALTGTTWKQRILGESKMTPDLPLFTVWYASGNNVCLRGDISRRVIPCRLETDEEHPEQRQGFRYPDLIGHVRQHRGELVAAGLTILRGYFTAGRPAAPLTPIGSFEGWSGLVRAAVHWATDLDPAATLGEIAAADETRSTLAALLEGWSQLPEGTGEGVTVADALRLVKDHPLDYQQLHDALMNWSRKDDKLPGSGVIGTRLARLRGRIVNGRSFQGEPDRNGVVRWRVRVG